MGFGKHSIIHTAKILRLSEDLPMIVEIADSLENIERFLPTLDEMIKDGLVTLEKVRVIQTRVGGSTRMGPFTVRHLTSGVDRFFNPQQNSV